MTQEPIKTRAQRSNADWGAIETLYKTTAISVRQIAKDHGVSGPAIAKRAARDKWVRTAVCGAQQIPAATEEVQTGFNREVGSQDACKAEPAGNQVQTGKRGRKSSYTPELGTHICLEIAGGKSLRKVCSMEGMPDMSTVLRWLADDEKEFFHKQYARACEARGVSLAEEAMEIVDQPVKTPLELAHNKAKADQRKWYASKLSPKRFGDKLAVGGADDLPPVQVQERELTDVERAVRVLNAIKSTPDALNVLLAGAKG